MYEHPLHMQTITKHYFSHLLIQSNHRQYTLYIIYVCAISLFYELTVLLFSVPTTRVLSNIVLNKSHSN